MKRPSPLVQLTMALVALASTLVILASVFLDVMPDRDAQLRATRQATAEALAVQLAERLARDDAISIEKTLHHLVTRAKDLRSVGIRRADGELLVESGGHVRQWITDADERSRPEQVSVPLISNDRRWGRVELAFAGRHTHPLIAFLDEPLVKLLLFVTFGGWLVFGLYMRRALQHLDPSTVVPERVQGAFDAMGEGVVVLDVKGRVMMCNKALRALDPALGGMNLGTRLSSLPWLAKALPTDPAEHPWARAMAERRANAGAEVHIEEGHTERRFVVNAAPISDPNGGVRGCMVTVSDMTALHHANEALRETMAQLQVSKQEVEHKNAELERLATRDPLTGVMNRRAFQAAFGRSLETARHDGRGVACLMVDIDHFKAVNDTHGHGIGDRVIQEVARRLQDSLRSTDLVCRWGGEEFCVVVVGLDVEGALDFAERLRQRIEREAGAAVREVLGLRVTCSFGLVVSTNADDTLEHLIEHADQALYKAKRGGRNRVAAPQASEPAATLPQHRDASVDGILNATGWAAEGKRLLEQARGADRTVLCLAMAGVGTGTLGADRDPDAPAAVALARLLRQAAPPRALITRAGDGQVMAMVAGWGIDDGEALAHALMRRVQNDAATHAGDVEHPTRLAIGLDALPARAPGAATLASRASQALGRLRRAGNEGIEHFVSRPAVGSATGTPTDTPAVDTRA